jgi:transglutaminase-like putative cysteine protease
MSGLRIHHETIYCYRKPVRFGPHRLILRPREGHDIRVEEMTLQIEPEFALDWSRDVFGNSVATIHLLQPAQELRIRNHIVLRQTAPFPLRTGRPVKPSAFPLEYSPFERVVAVAYQATTFPDDLSRVKEWVADQIDISRGEPAETIVAALNRRVRESIAYARRETKGVQTPAETLLKKSGSCRDMATLLLEALRALGFPARFASGYLHCRASEAGHASTHAWAEVYLPEIGWIGYDATSGELTSANHVVTGVSNHPRGVMPITGSFFGDAKNYVEMKVSVETERLSDEAGARKSETEARWLLESP